MILTQLKAYGFQALSGVLLVLSITQTIRLHSEQLKAAEATVALAKERTTTAKALVISQEHIRTTENALGTSAADTRKDTSEKTTVIDNRNAALLKRLRLAEATLATERLSKASTATSHGQAQPRDTGSELPNFIGEEDVQEAKRGDVIRIHLQACYREYDKARQALAK